MCTFLLNRYGKITIVAIKLSWTIFLLDFSLHVVCMKHRTKIRISRLIFIGEICVMPIWKMNFSRSSRWFCRKRQQMQWKVDAHTVISFKTDLGRFIHLAYFRFCAQIYSFCKLILVGGISLIIVQVETPNNVRGTVKTFVDTFNHTRIFWMFLKFISFSERDVFIPSSMQI